MAQQLVQINFTLNVSESEYVQTIAPLAQSIADTAGSQWKIWVVNQAELEAGGISLFADESSAAAFLAGPLVAQMRNTPLLREFQTKRFDLLTDLTEITRGPLWAYAQGL